MNNLFNLSNIIKESSHVNTLYANSNSSEVYLSTSINILTEMNKELNKNSKELYMSISESKNKTDENSAFCSYFSKFKDLINSSNNKISEMISRFIISADNIIDSNIDIINKDYMGVRIDPFSMNTCKFDIDKPVSVDIRGIYMKEFDIIGTLMQDLGVIATPEDKMKVIATVYNSFNKDMKKFQEDCIFKILSGFGIAYESEMDYSKTLYNHFRSECSSNIIKSEDIYTAKTNLSNYKSIINSVSSSISKSIADFNKIGEEIYSMIFRNEDCKLRIKTNTDGVANRDYQLDTYSMNQLDIFMKGKINQLSQLYNYYIIAVSIQLDAVIDYLTQNKDILVKANQILYPQPSVDNTSGEGNIVITNPGEKSEGIECHNGEYEDTLDQDNKIDDQTLENDDNKEALKEEEPVDKHEDDMRFGDYNTESYLFEYSLFELEQVYEQCDLITSISESMITEADIPDATKKAMNAAESNANNVWLAIVNKIAELWNEFKSSILKKNEAIEWINKHKLQYDSATVPDGAKTKLKKDTFKVLNDLEVVPLNWDSLKDYLEDDKTFIGKHYSDYIESESDKSFSEQLKNHILFGDENTEYDIASNKGDIYKFCSTDFNNLVKKYQQDVNNISKARNLGKNLAKQLASTNESFDYTKTIMDYFNEADMDGDGGSNKDQNQNQNNQQQNDNNQNNSSNNNEPSKSEVKSAHSKLKVYFKVSGYVLNAKLWGLNNVFSECYEIIKHQVAQSEKNGVGSKEGSQKAEDTKDVQFN